MYGIHVDVMREAIETAAFDLEEETYGFLETRIRETLKAAGVEPDGESWHRRRWLRRWDPDVVWYTDDDGQVQHGSVVGATEEDWDQVRLELRVMTK